MSQTTETCEQERIRKHCEYASRIVENWPAWKQNLLKHSSEPMNSVARPVILNTDPEY